MEKWAEVRVLFHREGLSQRAIARRLGISRDTVKSALESEEPSKYERPWVETSFDPFRARVRALLVDYPGMPASVLSQRVGWLGGESTLRRHVAGCVSSWHRWIRRIGWNTPRVINVNAICGSHR